MAVMPQCANCGTVLNGPYCSNCGQKASDYHRPIWWIAGEFLDSVFGYDSRTFRTLWLLFAEPGEFTRRYLDGKRASMLPPFRLFVIASLVFFLTLQLTGMAIVAFQMKTVTLPPAALEALKKDPEKQPGLTITDGNKVSVVTMEFFVPANQIQHVKLTAEQRRSVLDVSDAIKADSKDPEEQDWANWLRAKGRRISEGYERALADPLKLNGPMNVWLPRLMLVLVPVFALLLAATHWWPRVYLIEHIVFSTHVHTVVFVALSLAAVSAAFLGDSGFLWAVWTILAVYLWMAMSHVYRRSWWLTTIKFVGVLFVYSIFLLSGLGIVFALALAEV